MSSTWAFFQKIAETIHYGRIDHIEIRDNQPRFVRVSYDLKFDDAEDLKRKLDELRTLPIL